MRPHALIVALLLALPAAGQLKPGPKPAEPEGPLIPEGAAVEKVADGYKFTEGPTAVAHVILFSDIPNSQVLAFDTKTGKTTTFAKDTHRTNGLMFANGIIYGCSHGRRALVRFNGRTGEQTVVYDQLVTRDEDGNNKIIKFNSPNDLAVGPTGGIYFTDPRYGNRDSMETGVEGVYYFRQAIKGTGNIAKGQAGLFRLIDGGLTRPNGIVLSPDNKTLYVADHGANQIYAYDVVGPGEVKNKREFARLNNGEGRGSDGMCVDRNGRLYATGHGKVWVFEPNGEPAGTIDVGPQTTNCTFANDKKTLYITANKGLYRITLNTEAPAKQPIELR